MGNTSPKPNRRQMNYFEENPARVTNPSRGSEFSSVAMNAVRYPDLPPPTYEDCVRPVSQRVFSPSAPLERIATSSVNHSHSNNEGFVRTNPSGEANKFHLRSDNKESSVKCETLSKAGLDKKFDISYLLDLSLKDTQDIVKELKENLCSLKLLLEKPITPSLLLILMKLVKKICMSDRLDDKIEIFKIVCCEDFFNVLGGYISDLPTHTQDVAKEDWLFLMEGVLPFFECIVSLIPQQVTMKLRELIIKTKLSIHGIEHYQKLEMNDDSKFRLKKLESVVGSNAALSHQSLHSVPKMTSGCEFKEEACDTKVYKKVYKSSKKGSHFEPKKERSNKRDKSTGRPMSMGSTPVNMPDQMNFSVFDKNVRGVQKSVFFIERVTNQQESVSHAEFFIAFALYLTKQNYNASDIIMLTTSEIDVPILLSLKRRSKLLDKMTVQTIKDQDNVSASIVLLFLSLIEGRTQSVCNRSLLHKIFLGARDGIYMIGSMEYLAKIDSFWSLMESSLKKYEAMSTNLALCCQTHKYVSYVNTANDFKDLRNGGCYALCNMVLPCGHQCVRRCHSDDLVHKDYTCHKPCIRNPENCTRNHPCTKLCHEKCGMCQASVVISGVKLACYEVSQPNQNIQRRSVSQGGVQRNEAGKPIARSRGVSPHPGSKDKSQHHKMKSIVLPCGHFNSQKLQLPKKLDQWSLECVNLCRVPCSALLECGHQCSGTCGTCRQGKVHVTCCETRKIRLACGHRHVGSCNDGISNCEKKCFNECSHLKCREKCGILCTPCNKPCASKCKHSRCTKKCNEPCDRAPCRRPCEKPLTCGHQCISFCGEPCPPGPENCRICNPEKFKRMDSSGNARFVLLEECNHLVRANDLDRKISGNNLKLEGLTCPICHYNIVKTNRYWNYNKELHYNLLTIRNRYNEYCNELKNVFRVIIKEIKENDLPFEVENNPIIHEVKDHLKRAVSLQDIDAKSIIFLHFVRNIMCSVGNPPYTSMQWMLILLLERYERGFSSQVLKELYAMIIEYQRLNGKIHSKKVFCLNQAISFFRLLERDTWQKCPKGHITPCNSLLSLCHLCEESY